MRNVHGIHAERMMKPVSLGDGTILIQQNRKRDGMLLQEFPRLPCAIAFFGCHECHLRSCRFDFLFSRLKLSHALHAVRSPGPAQKLQDQRPMLEETAEAKYALAV